MVAPATPGRAAGSFAGEGEAIITEAMTISGDVGQGFSATEILCI
jgi:hypothetical protein